MNPFRKSSKISGQSVLEYSAIAMLVIVGILGMGPYVVRSVNAYFKTAEDQARDSFREEITQAPLDATEEQYDLGTCEFSESTGCGDGTNCPKNQIVKKMGGDCEGRYNDVFQCEAEPRPANAFLTGFPECIDYNDPEKDYKGCPVGASSQPPSDLFKGVDENGEPVIYGYVCCRDAKAAHPLRCGTIENGHPNQLLMVRECGRDMDNPERQYFWEDSQHCDYRCGQLDNLSEWCDPVLYNYDVPRELHEKVQYVDDGECAIVRNGGCPVDVDCTDGITCMAECRVPFEAGASGCVCPSDYPSKSGGTCCQLPIDSQVGRFNGPTGVITNTVIAPAAQGSVWRRVLEVQVHVQALLKNWRDRPVASLYEVRIYDENGNNIAPSLSEECATYKGRAQPSESDLSSIGICPQVNDNNDTTKVSVTVTGGNHQYYYANVRATFTIPQGTTVSSISARNLRYGNYSDSLNWVKFRIKAAGECL